MNFFDGEGENRMLLATDHLRRTAARGYLARINAPMNVEPRIVPPQHVWFR